MLGGQTIELSIPVPLFASIYAPKTIFSFSLRTHGDGHYTYFNGCIYSARVQSVSITCSRHGDASATPRINTSSSATNRRCPSLVSIEWNGDRKSAFRNQSNALQRQDIQICTLDNLTISGRSSVWHEVRKETDIGNLNKWKRRRKWFCTWVTYCGCQPCHRKFRELLQFVT